MEQGKNRIHLTIAGAVLLGLATQAWGESQPPAVPDAQVESNVLKALAASPQLTKQQIRSTTVLGVVTLSGSVPDEQTRSLAEDVVSRTAGVTKVIDELSVGASTNSATSADQSDTGATAEPNQSEGSNPLLQSDGTMAIPDQTDSTTSSKSQAGSQQAAPPQQLPSASSPPATAYPSNRAQYGQQPPAEQQGTYGQQASSGPPPPYSANQRPYYGQQQPEPYPYSQPYGPASRRYPGQRGGVPVTVPAGTVLQVRFNQGVDSRSTPAGSTFSGTVLREVVSDGFVAIPRGATVTGQVVNAESAGALKGHAELALQLTQITLGGRVYPLSSAVWDRRSGDKSVRSVDSALGLGVVGAIIGGVAGGGAGAAIGAGAGGAAGLGASAASGGGVVVVPPESVIAFQLNAPADLTTVSQAEMDRLSYSVPYPGQLLRRRWYAPPPPYAYGPAYYPYPRYYRPYPY